METFSDYFTKMQEGKTLTAKERDELDYSVVGLLMKMSGETITVEEQQKLDSFVTYITNNDSLANTRERNIVNEYEQIMYARKESQKELGRTKGPILQMRPVSNNRRAGVVLTVTIIEVVTLLGIVLAILILALAK